jgi:hypothetical protein
MVSDKNTQRNNFTIIFLCSFHKGIIPKDESSGYLTEVLVLGQNLVLGKPSILPHVGEVASPPTPIFVYLPQDLCQHTMRFAIFMIYKHIYIHPFKPM